MQQDRAPLPLALPRARVRRPRPLALGGLGVLIGYKSTQHPLCELSIRTATWVRGRGRGRGRGRVRGRGRGRGRGRVMIRVRARRAGVPQHILVLQKVPGSG